MVSLQPDTDHLLGPLPTRQCLKQEDSSVSALPEDKSGQDVKSRVLPERLPVHLPTLHSEAHAAEMENNLGSV